MTDLEKLPGLGPKTVRWLLDADIDSVATLRSVGAVAAYLRLKHVRPRDVSLNALWGLYGALNGIAWNRIDQETKQSLLAQVSYAPERRRGPLIP